MLDTDIVSFLVRGKTAALDTHLAAVPKKQVCISAVTRGELLFGLNLKDGAHRLAQVVDQFLQRVQCLPWDADASTHFAQVAASLHKAGTQVGSMEAMIAGHAIATGAVLVTNNGRHFSRVTGLNTENWTQDH